MEGLEGAHSVTLVVYAFKGMHWHTEGEQIIAGRLKPYGSRHERVKKVVLCHSYSALAPPLFSILEHRGREWGLVDENFMHQSLPSVQCTGINQQGSRMREIRKWMGESFRETEFGDECDHEGLRVESIGCVSRGALGVEMRMESEWSSVVDWLRVARAH
jgi:hypothetical protein